MHRPRTTVLLTKRTVEAAEGSPWRPHINGERRAEAQGLGALRTTMPTMCAYLRTHAPHRRAAIEALSGQNAMKDEDNVCAFAGHYGVATPTSAPGSVRAPL